MKKFNLLFVLLIASVAIFAKSTLNLDVKGMHCGGCEAKFKSTATGIAGVTEVTSVSAANGKAVIVYDEKLISDKKLVAELASKTGYNASASTSTGTVAVTGTPSGCCAKGQGAPACKEGESKKDCKKGKTKCDKKSVD